VAFLVPEEGTSLGCDDLVIPKAAREIALAHAWIDFLHDPEVAAENTRFLSYLCPEPGRLREARGRSPAEPGHLHRPEGPREERGHPRPRRGHAKYVKVWDEIKAAN